MFRFVKPLSHETLFTQHVHLDELRFRSRFNQPVFSNTVLFVERKLDSSVVSGCTYGINCFR